jgi:exopolysaccharide biosynthesis WecB/TagA/CpsF family protein
VYPPCIQTMTHVLHIDDYDLAEALQVAASFGNERFGYIVTPNVDHIIRHYRDRRFRSLYAQASLVLLDSRFLANTVGIFKRQILRVCLGSDLTTSMLNTVIESDDVVILVGGTAEQAQTLRTRFGLKALRHVDPPMNFIADPAAVEKCLRSIEDIGAFRFCFLAVGSPQQEIIAQLLKERGVARGLALCIGGAINFLTGVERRAPLWIQELGFEWLFRLLQNPRRLASRYLLRGPLIFPLLFQIELRVRPRATAISMQGQKSAKTTPTTPIAIGS